MSRTGRLQIDNEFSLFQTGRVITFFNEIDKDRVQMSKQEYGSDCGRVTLSKTQTYS